jgi:hypothetical protein
VSSNQAEDGYTTAEVDAAFVGKLDESARAGGVRYVSAVAGNGTRYAVTTSVLPLAGATYEGGPVLVTVTCPWVDAWALQHGGYLDESYVREHLCGGPLGRASDGDVRALTLLVRHALGRQGALQRPT